MEKRRVYVLIVILIIAAALGTLGLYSFYFGTTRANICQELASTAPGQAVAKNSSSGANFVIVETDGGPYEGINGSANHLSEPWPLMIVHQNQTVSIQIYNCASSEPHGFAVAHYFTPDIRLTIQTGQSQTVTFVANEIGNFTVYCSIFCAIHPLMQNGRLMVIP